MEGGGSHGAYEAGAMWTLANTLSAEDVGYDIVSGISTGALNAGGASQFAKGQEKEMADFLINTWLTIDGSDNIYTNWPGGLAQGLLFEAGLYTTEPLRNFLTKKLDKGINRKITIGATNLDTGVFNNFDESVGNANLVEAIMSSAAPPFIFPYQLFEGQTYADGGCLINLDVFQSIVRCYEETKNYKDIIVDLIFDDKIQTLPSTTSFTTLGVFSRVNQINSYYGGIWYYNQAQEAYPDVNFRYVIIPTQDMPGNPIVPLNFDQSVLEEEIQLGKTDAANVIKKGSNGREVIKQLYQEIQQMVLIP
jgi:Patatin-like phospholipase